MKNQKLVTTERLRGMDACSSQIRKFREVFGNRCSITLANVQKAYSWFLNVEWFLYHSVDEPIFNSYAKKRDDISHRYAHGQIPLKSEMEKEFCTAVYDALMEQIKEYGELDWREGPF